MGGAHRGDTVPRGCWCAARDGQVQLVLLPVLLLVGGWKPAAAVGGGLGVGVAWWCWQPLLDREG